MARRPTINPEESGPVQEFIGTAYDVVKAVHDNLDIIRNIDLASVQQTNSELTLIETNIIALNTDIQNLGSQIQNDSQEILDRSQIVQLALADFEKLYLGTLAADPSLNNNDDPLVEGNFYFNSTTNELKHYTGTEWISPQGIAISAMNSAALSANTATTQASQASFHNANAQTAKTSAESAALSAIDAKDTAMVAIIDAQDTAAYIETFLNDAVNAVNSATTSADLAQLYANDSANYATSASLSEAEAEAHKIDASGSALAAQNSENAAALSETAAATSATTASQHAQAASVSETTATNAANSAESSKIAAAVSEGNALLSANNASSSESSAAQIKVSIENLMDQFGDQYLGAKTADPTLDNDGNALATGAVYLNTTDNVLKFYSGTSWINPESNAIQAADAAEASALAASNSETAAGNHATSAQSSAASASTSKADAELASTNAQTSETNALASETAASTHATNANTSATNADLRATDAANSATAAQSAETTATTKATEAASSATAAQTAETGSVAAETKAEKWAEETTDIEVEPGKFSSKHYSVKSNDSAVLAQLSEDAAALSESNAATSATNAGTSETNAESSATAANTSATNAATSETNASTSAANALASESKSEAWAETAENIEVEIGKYSALHHAIKAALSATSASSSAATATTQAGLATTAKDDAVTAKNAAQAAETTATTKANEASASATAASTSETNAASSETNAANSASAAQTAETNAGNYAATAQTARDQALAAFDSFDDKYLGEKTTEPTVDNDGNPLVSGALYFNTTDGVMKVYDGTNWKGAYASLDGALLSANNLSDLGDVVIAKQNILLDQVDNVSAANLRDRTTHTGTQAISTITGLQTALNGKVGTTGYNNLNWDTAYSWGDHSTAGYLTQTTGDARYLQSYTETDPTVPAHVKNITELEKSNWNTAHSWGDHALVGYLTSFSETDPTVPNHVKSITTTEKSNWNTAHSWGDHALAGYANSVHSHSISDVTGLQTALDGKANTSHTHAIADITNLQTSLDDKVSKTGDQSITGNLTVTDIISNAKKIGTFTWEGDVNGDHYVGINAYHNGTDWVRYDTAKVSWLYQHNLTNNMIYEGYKGNTLWRCRPGTNPINGFTNVGGWLMASSMSEFGDYTLGGNGIEVDGHGTTPYGRLIHSTVGGLKYTGILTNVFLDYSDRDSSTEPSLFAGWIDDGAGIENYKIQRAPSGASLNWTDLFSVSNAGNITFAGTISGNGFGLTNLDAIKLNGQAASYYLDFNNLSNLPDPTITLTGDMSGSITMTNLAGGFLNATFTGRVPTFDVLDVRNLPGSNGTATYHYTPNELPDNRVGAYFGYMSESNWQSCISVKGWSDTYTAWELIGPSSSSTNNKWYLRSGVSTSWGTAYEIYHEGHKPTPAEIGAAASSHIHSNYIEKTPTSGGVQTIIGDLDIDNRTQQTSTLVRVIANDAGTAELRLQGPSASTGRLFVGQSTTYGGGIEYAGDGTDPGNSGAGMGYTALFRVSGGTNASPNRAWTARNQVNSNDWEFRGNGTFYASDERLKENIKSIPNSLEKLKQINGVTFDWKDECEEIGFLPTMKHETGFIAQNIQKVIEDAVYPAPFNNAYLTIKAEKILPLVVEALKEEVAKRESLEERIERLEKLLESK